MLPTPFALSLDKRQNRSLTQDVTPFLHNIIFQYTNPLPFETEPHTIHTIPLAREHCDSGLYYIRYTTLDITTSQKPFQVTFNPVKNINTGTYYRTIHPQNITLSIQEVFITYIEKLIEFNENLDPPPYCPSHLDELRHKSQYFDVPDLETKVQKHDNPHYWLQQDILQIKNFQYRLFHNITFTDETIPQVKTFTHFLLKFFRFTYQLLWEQQDQQAYINFPHILSSTELWPYIIKNEHKHIRYRDPTSFNITYFEQITLDHNCISEHFETSDNRPYCSTNISPETLPEEQSAHTIPQLHRQNTLQSDPDNPNHLFNTQTPPQPNPFSQEIFHTPDPHQINPSDTVTIHNT